MEPNLGVHWQETLLEFLATDQAEDTEVSLRQFLDLCGIMSIGKFGVKPVPSELPEHLMFITSEVSEVYEEHRKGRAVDEIYWENGKPEGIPIEMADVILKTLYVAEAYGMDMMKALRIKLIHNANKKRKKNGERYV